MDFFKQLHDGGEINFSASQFSYSGNEPALLKITGSGGKKCALVGISDGVAGNAIGLSHITDVFNYLGMPVMAQKIRIPCMKKNFVEGEITDEFIKELITDQAQNFIKF
jgi:chromate reductase